MGTGGSLSIDLGGFWIQPEICGTHWLITVSKDARSLFSFLLFSLEDDAGTNTPQFIQDGVEVYPDFFSNCLSIINISLDSSYRTACCSWLDPLLLLPF